jgi:hypothetical protein
MRVARYFAVARPFFRFGVRERGEAIDQTPSSPVDQLPAQTFQAVLLQTLLLDTG